MSAERNGSKNIAAVISDRKCGALDVASDYQIQSICYDEKSAHVFSDICWIYSKRKT